jgi:hypothetical protein
MAKLVGNITGDHLVEIFDDMRLWKKVAKILKTICLCENFREIIYLFPIFRETICNREANSRGSL